MPARVTTCHTAIDKALPDPYSHGQRLRRVSRISPADSGREKAMPTGSPCRPADQVEEMSPRESLSVVDEGELRLLEPTW
jgi:hypothetical protein